MYKIANYNLRVERELTTTLACLSESLILQIHLNQGVYKDLTCRLRSFSRYVRALRQLRPFSRAKADWRNTDHVHRQPVWCSLPYFVDESSNTFANARSSTPLPFNPADRLPSQR